jgi:hypothetical protein
LIAADASVRRSGRRGHAERTLELFEANLRTFEDHLTRLKTGNA